MMTSQKLSYSDLNKDKRVASVSYRNGYWFYFQVNGLEIAAHGSAISGKETIYVNDNPVSEGRNFRRTSEHTFVLNNIEYRVVFNMVSMMRGELVCELYVDGILHSSESKAYFQNDKMKSMPWLIFWMLLGMVCGATFGYTLFSWILS